MQFIPSQLDFGKFPKRHRDLGGTDKLGRRLRLLALEISQLSHDIQRSTKSRARTIRCTDRTSAYLGERSEAPVSTHY
jgi:hypothetical protein